MLRTCDLCIRPLIDLRHTSWISRTAGTQSVVRHQSWCTCDRRKWYLSIHSIRFTALSLLGQFALGSESANRTLASSLPGPTFRHYPGLAPFTFTPWPICSLALSLPGNFSLSGAKWPVNFRSLEKTGHQMTRWPGELTSCSVKSIRSEYCSPDATQITATVRSQHYLITNYIILICIPTFSQFTPHKSQLLFLGVEHAISAFLPISK